MTDISLQCWVNQHHPQFNDTIIYRTAAVADANLEAPAHPAEHGPYQGKIVDFTDDAIGVRADGMYGQAPLYYVAPGDITQHQPAGKEEIPMTKQKRVHLMFDAPNGLRYDTALHDFVEPDGSLASAERVAHTWGMTVEEVEQDRRERQERAPSQRPADE